MKVAYWATARIAGTVPASVFLPRPKVESALADIRRRPSPAVDVPPEPLFQLVRTAFGQRRKMLRRSLATVVAPEVFDAAGIDAQRRPEELDIVEWGALTSGVVGGQVSAVVVIAPAKLTLSLRITGVRDDGYHLIDAEMVTLDWHDTLTIDPSSTGLTADGPYAEGPADGSSRTSSRKALRHCRSHGGSAHPQGAATRWRRSVADLPMPPQFCDGRATTDVAGAARARRRRGVLSRRRSGPRSWHRRGRSNRCRSSRSTSRWSCHRCRSARQRVYVAWDQLGGPHSDGHNDLEPAAVSRVHRTGTLAGPDPRGRRNRTRRLPAAGRRGSSAAITISTPRCPMRRGSHDREPAPDAKRPPAVADGRKRDLSGSLAALALVTGTTKHLLVLLLAHSLAAFLDQRTHSS